MNFTELDDDPEDPQHTPAERSAAASRSTWVSVGVNIVLSTTRVNLNTVLGWRETRTSPLRSCMQDVLFSQNMDDNAQEMIDSGDASD